MPDAADKKDDHDIDIGSDSPPAASAQGEIDIGSQKTG